MTNARFWVPLFLVSALVDVPAHAQDAAAAEALFREARQLLKDGQVPAACAKFVQSQHLDPSSGTLLNVAACHEKEGKTASAWAEYLAAARLANSQNRSNLADEASQRASNLEPTLSTLTITVAEPVTGLTLHRDDVVLDGGVIGTGIPIDPGPHVVRATAPGYEPVEVRVEVGARADRARVALPKLVKPAETRANGSRSSAEPVVVDHENPRSSPTLAYVAGGIGVVGIGVGTVFGVMAKSSYDTANGACPTHVGCSDSAMSERSRAGTRAMIANVAFGVGVAGLGLATVLILTNGPAASTSTSASHFDVRVRGGRQSADFAVLGTFD